MSNTTIETQKAIVLWLSGIRLTDIRTLPEVEMLLDRGSLLELNPLPITGPQAQYYQAFSGQLPSSFGFFDTLVPRNYATVEEVAGRGPTPKLLPDLLRTVGWTVQYEEVQSTEVVTHVQEWTQSDTASPTCQIVNCSIGKLMPDIS